MVCPGQRFHFQVLTRRSSDARAFGNIVRFLAGPARVVDMFLVFINITSYHKDESFGRA